MKHFIRFMVLISIVVLFQHHALAADPLKVGVVDLQKCIEQSNEGKRVYSSLKEKHDSMQERLNEKQKELAQMQKDIEKQSLMLSLDAKEDKQRDFERKRRDLGYLLQDMNEEMNKAEANARKKILQDVEDIVKTIAKKGNYDLILEKRTAGVMFISDPLDISEKIIEAYNKAKP